MAAASHRTRLRLLDAGLDLADEVGLGEVSINDIVSQAQVAKGTFYVHFSDRSAFLLALHRRFHDNLRATIREAVTGLDPGRDRWQRSTVAYLDGCLQARGVKAMLLHARGVSAIAEEVARSNDRFAKDAAKDFNALGIDHSFETARLFVAMAAEVALLECRAGRANTALRAALWQLVELE